MSDKDPLATFRKGSPSVSQQTSQRTASSQTADNLQFYQAFGQTDHRLRRLEIHQVLGESHAPDYRYLMDIMFNGDQGTQIVLVYSFLMVKIAGRNMQPILRAILDETCTFIQDYHPNEFTPPTNDAPVIENIEIIVRKE